MIKGITRQYTLMLIRDDGKALRLRMGTKRLRVILLLLLFIFPVLAGLGVWFTWTLWQDRLEYSAHRATVQASLDDARAELGRLNSLKVFLEQRAPLTLMSMIDPAASQDAQLPAGVDSQIIAQLTELTQMEKLLYDGAAQVAAQLTPPGPSAQPAAAVPPATQANGAGSPAAGAGAATAPGTAQTPVPQPVAQVAEAGQESIPEADSTTDSSVASGLVRVENLLLSRSGASGLRVSFDIYNTEQQPQIGGHTSFDLVQASGITPLTVQGDVNFRIKRLKKIVGYPNLPRTPLGEDAKLRINVNADDGSLLYRVDVPLP